MPSTLSNASFFPLHTDFSKQQLCEELVWFMPAMARSFERLFGMDLASGGAATIGLDQLQASPLWRSLNELYDYGLHGVLPSINELGDGSLVDVELFLGGLDGLEDYLKEDDGGIPRLAVATVKMAKARQQLDECSPDDLIKVDDVALLARRGLREVCAALDSEPGATIPVLQARSLLLSQFQFIPTGSTTRPKFQFLGAMAVELPLDLVRAINHRAGDRGIAPVQLLRALFSEEIGRDGDAGLPGFMCFTQSVDV